MLSPKDAWHATLGQLQLQLNRATFDTWLKGSEVLAYENGEFYIRVRHAYAKDWLEKRLGHVIPRTLSSIFGQAVTINYIVNLPKRPYTSLDSGSGPLFEAHAAAKTIDSKTTETAAAKVASPESRPSVAPLSKVDKSHDVTGQKTASQSTPTPSALSAAPNAIESKEGVEAHPDPVARESSDDLPDITEWDPRYHELPRRHSTQATQTAPRANSPFDSQFTFETFVTGPTNQFAFAAAEAVAKAPGTAYNPLVVYGGTGLGKTHLLHAIGHICELEGKQVLYVTGEAFTNELVAAIRDKTTEDFRARYRSVDVLMVDDVQFLAGKTSSEEEFYHTFNAIFSSKGQVVVACNQHPRAISKLDDRLRSRFEGGLLADIQPPEEATRHAILKSKSAAQGSELPDDVAAMLAQQAIESVRELEGLLTQVLARATLAKQPLTVTLAQTVLNKHAVPTQPQTPDLKRIFETAATHHQLSLDDLLSKKRTKDVVRARQIAMYLARQETDASYPEIGKALGGRNHSTILYGFQKIAEMLKEDDALERDLGDIRRQLYLFSKD